MVQRIELELDPGASPERWRLPAATSVWVAVSASSAFSREPVATPAVASAPGLRGESGLALARIEEVGSRLRRLA